MIVPAPTRTRVKTPSSSTNARRHVSPRGGSAPSACVPEGLISEAGHYTDSRTALNPLLAIAEFVSASILSKSLRCSPSLASERGNLMHSTNRLSRVLTPALVAGTVVAAAILSLTGTARGAGQRATAAAIELTQTCSSRIQPNATVQVEAVVSNTGDVQLDIPPGGVVGDAGTHFVDADDFSPPFSGGDTNGNNHLDPGENWTYDGSYKADDEDLANIFEVEARTTVGAEPLNDLAPCETDVIQPPAPGKIVGVSKVNGTVLIKKKGTSKFVALARPTEIPVGSQVDTTRGTIKLVAGLGGGRKNSSNFYSGKFLIQQAKKKNAFMILVLQGGNFRSCGRSLSAYSTHAKSRRPVRRLWGNGKGRFTSKGRYSSATVRGTKWLVQDQCNATLTVVKRGVVQVRDFTRHKTVDVRAGGSYLAATP